jgi:ammonia channel protein AmtB
MDVDRHRTRLLHDARLGRFLRGLVGEKNVIATMAQSFVAIGIASMLWIVVGYPLAFGPDHGGIGGGIQERHVAWWGKRSDLLRSTHSGTVVHGIPNDVCGHNAGADRRCLRAT